MPIFFKIEKYVPPAALFEDHFTTFDSAVWTNLTNMVAPTIVNDTWLNWQPSATYGDMTSKDLELSPTGDNFKITARVKRVGAIVGTVSSFGLKYEGCGLHWYRQSSTYEVWVQTSTGSNLNWKSGHYGIQDGTYEPINVTISQKSGIFSMSVAYEEAGYEIYDWSDSVSFTAVGDGSGALTIGRAYLGTQWEVDYITLDLPD